MTTVTKAAGDGDHGRDSSSFNGTAQGRIGCTGEHDVATKWVAEIATAADEGADTEELVRLAAGHVWARWRVASNRACPPSLLEALAMDEVPLVRRAAALNPNTPREIRRRLSLDPDDRVALDVEISTDA